MMYEDVVADFAKRTRANLRTIDELRTEGRESFEVTQLVNSMLGLIVFPREEFLGRVPRIPLRDLEAEGWPVPKVRGGFAQVPDLNELVRYLRNAIAHFNIEFIADTAGHIGGVRVWNKDRGKKTWEADLGIAELRGIAERFTDLLLDNSLVRSPADHSASSFERRRQ